jgi:cytochrome c
LDANLIFMNNYNITIKFVLFVGSLFLFAACSQRSGSPKILVFSKTAGFYHESIPDGLAAIQKMGRENDFEVDTTTNAELFNEENLKQYSAVVFLSTTGDVLNPYQQVDFERYIQAGGGFVGIHAAADTEYEWAWYGEMVGGYFADHPGINDPHPNVQKGLVRIVDPGHSTTDFLPKEWERTDEWYSYKDFNEEVNVLMTLDEASYQGGLDMGEHPIAWYHEYDGGRAFYTGGGHTSGSFEEELFLRHILEGINYSIGGNKALDYSKAITKRLPEENRFTKVDLTVGEFTEPTEMTVLPNLDILIAQRRGEVLLYKNGDSAVNQIAHLDVYWKTEVEGVNAEEGLMGLQADPNFAENHYVYLFYSPTDTSTNRLSRFKFENDQLDLESETTILEFYSQRDICCHTGGSIAFGGDGLLYVSAGDNSTPFNQTKGKFTLQGYAPLDDRPGFEQYDAARSSGNTNDLRGKILRIRVLEDGSYEIPEGNLYPEGMEGTRPEIYVQGNRNPYRISVDKKTGFLYWGEVGPDARLDSMDVRGPRGYDEVNQAKEAGYFGWPFFVGNNYPYRSFDFDKGEPGQAFDPAKPVNLSRNNTGLKELPPAQPAFIWYPYDVSPDFPQVGTGGRNAMAGPVYYSDLYPESTRLPDYFDGKLFIYDWIRGWIKVVTMDSNGDFVRMEPFMPGTTFNSLIDMEMGPDGKLYLLEYGSGWFSQNPNAALSRVDFNAGNRSPQVKDLAVSKTSGMAPLAVEITASASDPENDPLTYRWNLGNGEIKETTEPNLQYTYEQNGDYSVSVEVVDPSNLIAHSNSIDVYVGNVAPEITINVKGNQSFYFPGKNVEYQVEVTDQNDPEAGQDLSSLVVSADYLEGLDQAEASMGHLIMTEAMVGKALVESLTCKSCHKVDEVSVGPAYTAVAAKYQDNPQAEAHLINKIIKGGTGVWGETMMPANPEMKESDAKKIVSWVLSLAGDQEASNTLPASGSVDPTVGKPVSANGVFVLSASFTDKGGDNIKPLTGSNSLILQNSQLDLGQATNLEGFTALNRDGRNMLDAPFGPGHFSFDQIDLTGITSVDITAGSEESLIQGYKIWIKLDGPEGRTIGETTISPGNTDAQRVMASVKIEPVTDGKLHDLYILTEPIGEDEEAMALISVELKAE